LTLFKARHELRDGVHGFIYFDALEKQLIDSAPFQRLRSVHQLAMSYHVYPGATHKRFEHSLGVMDVASRIFDTLFDKRLDDKVYQQVAHKLAQKEYWRSVVRAAALLHDLGHLPFSHAAEKELLPEGWNHERFTAEIIRHSSIKEILTSQDVYIRPEDVIDVACDIDSRTRHEPGFAIDQWKTMLNEIVTGDTFGADRIDYLLRDARHAGVPYGTFDSDLLIDGLRAVINPYHGVVSIGLDAGAIHAAEALLLARFFMYTQVYFHKTRRTYNIHLQEFLKAWLPGGMFSSDWRQLVEITDDEVIAAIRTAAQNNEHPLHPLAMRLMGRQHFRTAYQLLPMHEQRRPQIFRELCDYMRSHYEADDVRFDSYAPKTDPNDFLVVAPDGLVDSSLNHSPIAERTNLEEIGLILVTPRLKAMAQEHIAVELNRLLLERPLEEGRPPEE